MRTIIFVIATILGLAAIGLLMLVVLDVLNHSDLQRRLKKERNENESQS